MASGIPYGTKGIQDPFQCRTESRRTYAKMSQQTMTELLTPVGECMCLPSSYNTSKHPLEQPGGSLTGELPNPAVKREILRRIRHEDVIRQLRKETVPPGFTYHTWTPGIYNPSHK